MYAQTFQTLTMDGINGGFFFSKNFNLSDKLVYRIATKSDFTNFNINHQLKYILTKNLSTDFKLVNSGINGRVR